MEARLRAVERHLPYGITTATTTKWLKVKGGDIALNRKTISELRSVTGHPTQVDAPHLNSSQIGWYSIYLPRRDRRLS